MVSKDQAIGGAILIVCVIVAIVYAVLAIFPGWFSGILNAAGDTIRLDMVLVLVSIAFIAILAIGAWIGWTMATTPPPKPIEEITTEIEEKKEEEKKEEPKAEEPAPVKPDEAPATEEKATTKKKK
ncbi:MAG: transcriptional regulator [Candidatus Bathyarchaeia archaeon]|jgi:predicted DNA-binding transcriptional regulator